jgi:endoglycosylceramidase
MRTSYPVILALLSLVANSQLTVNTKSRMIEDEYKRTVILHGVNVVYKQDPYIPSSNSFDPQLSLTDAEITQLKEWGFNFVRLGVMWEAVERRQGEYDDGYL